MKKKLLPALVCIMFYAGAFSQSVSLKDMQRMQAGPNVKAFLVSKSFAMSNPGSNPEIYFKNKNTDKQERVIYDNQHGGVIYNSRNLAHLTSLISDLQKRFNLMLKNESPKDTFYQFGDAKVTIYVNINKSHGAGSISLSKK